MTARAFRSYAKVNLHLQVVGRRPDGYHELRTVFQMIDLCDEVEVELVDGEGIELTVDDPRVPAGPANLAWRAAAAFRERWTTTPGVRVVLRKRIPPGGGLGGGSSNAAAVLLALSALAAPPAAPEELWRVARSLGADVPFFLTGGTAVGFGRGDEVVPLPDLEDEEPLWLALPAVEVSTRAVFEGLGDLTGAPLAPTILALLQGRVACRIEQLLGWNDLQPLVLRQHPVIAGVHDQLLASGAGWVRLSGSGAALIARFADPADVGRAAERLGPQCRLLAARPVTRGAWQRQWREG